jgi:hypothetical protein
VERVFIEVPTTVERVFIEVAIIVVRRTGMMVCRAALFRGNGAGVMAHYGVGIGRWNTVQSASPHETEKIVR